MPQIQYINWPFKQPSLAVIAQANAICYDYAQQGFDLTLRQLYYQFVSRGHIQNSDREYKRLGDIIGKARLAGLMDWNYINDRTRNLRVRSRWNTPAQIQRAVAEQYHKDMWRNQRERVEVWIEKDALVGVIESVCNELDVPHFSCRGYTSLSEVWSAARRIEGYLRAGQRCRIIHLGDHDPSGIDMTRDITDRLTMFLDGDGFNASKLFIQRVALNEDQVTQYNPPPNPAKLTDSRSEGYVAKFGNESWELDALEPNVIVALVREHIEATIDWTLWERDNEQLERERAQLMAVANRWQDVRSFLAGDGDV